MRVAALAFLLGIIFLQACNLLPSAGWGWLALICLPLLWLRPLRLPVWVLLGFCWALWRAHLILAVGLPAELEQRDVVVTGRVVGLPVAQGRRLRFDFEVETLEAEGQARLNPGRVRLTWYYPLRLLQPGERWRLTLRLKRPHGSLNPGGFDQEGWLFQQGLRATGYVRQSPAPGYLGLDVGVVSRLQRARQRLQQRLAAAPLRADITPLVQALVIGERSGVDAQQWRVFQATGTNHLLAISGLHIGLVAGLAFGLGRWAWSRSWRLTLRLPAQLAGAALALLAATGYAALAGFSVPTQRAWVMVVVVMLAWFGRRRTLPSEALALALWAVLLWDPLAVLAPGFWLSFAAVAVILLVVAGPRPTPLWRRWGRLQWAVSIGLAPLLLFWFQQLSLVAPLANLIAIPWVSLVVVPLLFAALVLLSVPVLGVGLLQLAGWALAGLWQLLAWLATPPWQLWTQPSPPLWALLLALVGVAWWLLPRGVPARWLGLVWLLPALLATPTPLPPGSVRFALLDVGQGLAAVVQTRSHSLVFDTGPGYGERFDSGAATVLPYLRQQGIGHIDTLMVSHGDNDHIGGAASILAGMEVGEVVTSVPAQLPQGRPCIAGEGWQWDGVAFEVLHPPAAYYQQQHSDNNRSCVLRVVTAAGAILLTGDIEAPAEQHLLVLGQGLHADYLVAPHHGSRSSSTVDFIRAVAPRYVLFPVGHLNRYRFPSAEVVGRYRDLGVTALDTARGGALLLTLGGGPQPPPQAYREAVRRYWHSP